MKTVIASRPGQLTVPSVLTPDAHPYVISCLQQRVQSVDRGHDQKCEHQRRHGVEIGGLSLTGNRSNIVTAAICRYQCSIVGIELMAGIQLRHTIAGLLINGSASHGRILPYTASIGTTLFECLCVWTELIAHHRFTTTPFRCVDVNLSVSLQRLPMGTKSAFISASSRPYAYAARG